MAGFLDDVISQRAKATGKVQPSVSAAPAAPATKPAPDNPFWWQALKAADDAARGAANAMTFGGADKFAQFMGELDTEKKTAEARTHVPYMIGEVAGAALPISKASKAIGAAVPALRGTNVLKTAGREALASGAYSAAEQTAEEGSIDPTSLAAIAAVGGLAGPLAQFGLRSTPTAIARRVKTPSNISFLAKTLKNKGKGALDDPRLMELLGLSGKEVPGLTTGATSLTSILGERAREKLR